MLSFIPEERKLKINNRKSYVDFLYKINLLLVR